MKIWVYEICKSLHSIFYLHFTQRCLLHVLYSKMQYNTISEVGPGQACFSFCHSIFILSYTTPCMTYVGSGFQNGLSISLFHNQSNTLIGLGETHLCRLLVEEEGEEVGLAPLGLPPFQVLYCDRLPSQGCRNQSGNKLEMDNMAKVHQRTGHLTWVTG